MKTKIQWVLTIFMVLGLVLSACSPTATAPAEPVVVEDVQPEPEPEEPVVEEPAPVAELDMMVLDAAYETFLGDMEKYNTIGLDALNTALAENSDLFVLDVRSPSEAEEKGHIPGAIMIPLRELADNLAYLPSFDTPIVTYCGSGWRCTIALTALEAMGWEDVTCLKGGSFGGWLEAGYAVAEGVPAEGEMLNAAMVDPSMVAYFSEVMAGIPEGYGGISSEALNTALVENPDLVVIDARTTGEVDAKGVIPADNWLHIPLEQFIAQQDLWPLDLDTPIVINCGSGHRSTIAMAMMWSYGYTDVKSLKSGFGDWVAQGYPVVGTMPDLDPAFGLFLGDMEKYNTIGLEALNTALAENPDLFVLDVRNPSEAEEKGHIPGSILIPLRDLAKNLAYLPSFDTPIVTYCGSGWRCTIAATALEAMGWEDVTCLKGGSFGGWVAEGYAVAEGLQPEAEMLNAVKVDYGTAAYFDDVLTNVPDGYGGITAEALNTALLENPDLIVIDTRTTGELAEKGVIGADNFTSIPLEQFIAMQDLWPMGLDAPIVVYCGSGHRSTIAMTILWSYGYTDVKSLKSGFGGWVADGYQVVEFVAQ